MELQEISETIEIEEGRYQGRSVHEFYEILKTYEKTLIDNGFQHDRIKLQTVYDYYYSWMELVGVRPETVDEAIHRENEKLEKAEKKLAKKE